MLMLSCVVLYLACVCVAAIRPEAAWTPTNYPNPQTNPRECGRPPNSPSWICDPNGIITKDEARVLDYMISAIASPRGVTPCPCSAYQCDRDSSGYKIGIALMRKIKMDKSFDDLTAEEKKSATVHSARKFAYELMMDKWSYGNCEETVIILFSQEDNIIFMMSGDTAKLKLTDELMKVITDHAGPHFAPGQDVSVGLKYMVIHLRNVFNDNFYNPTPVYGKGGARGVTFSVCLLLSSLLATLHLISI